MKTMEIQITVENVKIGRNSVSRSLPIWADSVIESAHDNVNITVTEGSPSVKITIGDSVRVLEIEQSGREGSALALCIGGHRGDANVRGDTPADILEVDYKKVRDLFWSHIEWVRDVISLQVGEYDE